jgi:hypothetical protein
MKTRIPQGCNALLVEEIELRRHIERVWTSNGVTLTTLKDQLAGADLPANGGFGNLGGFRVITFMAKPGVDGGVRRSAETQGADVVRQFFTTRLPADNGPASLSRPQGAADRVENQEGHRRVVRSRGSWGSM